MKTFNQFAVEQHVDHKGNPITMQDIRLLAGEGRLGARITQQAVDIIKKQRKQRDDLIKNYKG